MAVAIFASELSHSQWSQTEMYVIIEPFQFASVG